ncbi:MAG TPA: alpha/beta hydrolase [Allosphingosinicella sp.]|jgi:pimeloyl-ACP methyl ester carboxylesterase
MALLRFALTAFALLAAAPAAAAPAAAGPLRIEPTTFKLADGSELAVERGAFSVSEDRRDPRSRRIEIGFIRFKSTNPRPGPPIVYLAGGPGGSGVATARGPRQPVFLALRAVADVIALDQRGIGLSNRIPPCTAKRKLDPAAVLTEATLTAYHRETLEACLAEWRSAGVAVNGYTTEQNADDLEDLRKALGARKIDLWGISYGTHLAFAAMRRHPRSIGRVALASAEGLDQTVKLPAHLDAAFARIERFAPGLTARMRRVHARYDSEPQAFALPDGGPSFRTDGFPLRMMAGILPKNPDGIARLVGAYQALEAGQTQALAPLIWGFFYKDPLTMSGMPELTDIASGITDGKLAAVRRQAPASLLGTATNFPMPQLRGAVPGLDLGDAFRREIRSEIPVLLLSGDLDVRTPLEEQAMATAGLRRLHRIVVRNGGHDLFEAHPDVPAILVDFFSGRKVAVRELMLPPPSATPSP